MATTEQAATLPGTTTGAGPGNLPASALPAAPAPAPSGTGISLTRPGTLATLSGLGFLWQQPAVRKAFPAIVALAVLIIAGSFYLWSQETPYRSVFPGMVEADQQSALELLKSANLSPRLDPSNGQVTVPVARYHEARILLSSQGIPRSQSRGILDSLKDQSPLTTSQFMEQARYNAAIEQELAKSIVQISSVQSARVHLAQVKPTSFVRERTPSKASVVVSAHPGMVVSAGQVQAIVHLVSSSVPYLAAEDVAVVDQSGNLLSKSAEQDALGMTSLQAKHKAQLEDLYRSRILQLLEPVLGEGNVKAQVDLALDFTEVETATEDFDTKNQGPKTRSEALSEERGTRTDPSGVPGALSNTAPPEPKVSSDTSTSTETKPGQEALSSKSTRNYELDKSVRHVRNAPGAIVRVSAAVVVRERVQAASKENAAKGVAPSSGYAAEELERLSGLVKGVVGFNAERGDQVTLVPAKFESSASPGSLFPWYESENLIGALKAAVAGLVVLVVLFALVRPVVQSYLPAKPAAATALPDGQAGTPGEAGMDAAAAAATGAGDAASEGADVPPEAMSMQEGETLEDFKERLKRSAPQKKSSISADMLDTANTYDDKVALIRMLVQEDSGRVATVLKNMIKQGMVA